jgi:hypothetical protein
MSVIEMSYFKEVTGYCKYEILKVTKEGTEHIMWLCVNKTKFISHFYKLF